MSEMIERVARVLHKSVEALLPHQNHVPWEGLSESTRADLFREAGRIIEAMREPDEAMKRAGSAQPLPSECWFSADASGTTEEGATSIFTAMIDKALNA